MYQVERRIPIAASKEVVKAADSPPHSKLVLDEVRVVLGRAVREVIPVEQRVVDKVEIAVVEIAVHGIEAVEDDPPSVAPGDVVLTSALGGLLPPGLLVGRVAKVEAPDQELHQRIEVAPLGDLDRIEQVLIMTGFRPGTDLARDDEREGTGSSE